MGHSEKHEVDVDLRIFDLDIIKSVVYRMSSRCSVELTIVDQRVVCSFHNKKPITDEEWHLLADEFRRQLVDQDLRKRIGKETEAYRNLILGLAFSKTGLQSGE